MMDDSSKIPAHAVHDIVGSIALCPPGIRTVVIIVRAIQARDGSWRADHEVFPVVAVRSTVMHHYLIAIGPDGREPSKAATPEQMIDLGWQYESTYTVDQLLICDVLNGLVDAETIYFKPGYGWKVCVCPWPPSEDEKRLAKEIAEVRGKTLELITSRATTEPSGGTTP